MDELQDLRNILKDKESEIAQLRSVVSEYRNALSKEVGLLAMAQLLSSQHDISGALVKDLRERLMKLIHD